MKSIDLILELNCLINSKSPGIKLIDLIAKVLELHKSIDFNSKSPRIKSINLTPKVFELN